jgi:hypothetical protein
VKTLNQRINHEERDNAQNRVARSLDRICKFIDEFEGLKGQK